MHEQGNMYQRAYRLKLQVWQLSEGQDDRHIG
jgi:hypothetical protein